MADAASGGDLAARIEALERRVAQLSDEAARSGRRRLLIGGLAVASPVLLVALVALARDPALAGRLGFPSAVAPRLMDTEKGVGSGEFSLRNAGGAQMSVLECDKFGAPNLVMMDLARRYRVGLKVWDDGRADLNFYDTAGRHRGRFGVSAGGEVGLILSSDEGREHARLSVSADGEPTFRLSDAEGNVVFQAP